MNFTDPSGNIPCEQMPTECQTDFNGGEDWTAGNWSIDPVINAFPFIFVDWLTDYIIPGIVEASDAYQFALEDTKQFVEGYTSGSGWATGVQTLAGNIQGKGGALPSDWLSNDVTFIIGSSYLLSSEAMSRIGEMHTNEVMRIRASTSGTNYGANNAANGVRLNRSLASQQQMGEPGSPIAGAPGTAPFRNASRVANTYGGQSSDWVKMSSTSYVGVDGFKFQTHWVQNMQTGLRVEFKTMLTGWGFTR